MLSVVILSVVMLSVVTLNAVVLSAVKLNVVAQKFILIDRQLEQPEKTFRGPTH